MAKPLRLALPISLLPAALALITTFFLPSTHSENVYVACGSNGHFLYAGKTWGGDADFVSSGLKASVAAPVPLNTLRFFPNLPPVAYHFTNFAPGTQVRITTQFYYGNCSFGLTTPRFVVKYDTNPNYTVVSSRSETVTYSLTYRVPSSGKVTVYLAGDDKNPAFVNNIQVEETGGGPNLAKIVAPVVVTVFVVGVASVAGFIYHSRKKRREQEEKAHQLYMDKQSIGPDPQPMTTPSPRLTHGGTKRENQEEMNGGPVSPTVETHHIFHEKYDQQYNMPPNYPVMESNDQPRYWQGYIPHEQPRTQLEISHAFTYAQIKDITGNFKNRIGKGGSGVVYFGQLNDGREVAVKVLNESLPRGASEFIAEVRVLLTVHHKYIAGFVGYCEDASSLILIYEYMKGGNLREILSGKNSKSAILTWKTRLQIAENVAMGLDYLHSGCQKPIIHRDVKTTNILLTEKLEAKIADFGLSRAGINEDVTYVSTVVVGTPGYIDPEYYQTNRLTKKSDVYSFGVVLLELISGHSPIMTTPDGRRCSLVQWAIPLLAKGDVENVADPILIGQYSVDSMWKVVQAAMACTSNTSSQRPTMTDVVNQLRDAMDLQARQGATGANPFAAGAAHATMGAASVLLSPGSSSTEYSTPAPPAR